MTAAVLVAVVVLLVVVVFVVGVERDRHAPKKKKRDRKSGTFSPGTEPLSPKLYSKATAAKSTGMTSPLVRPLFPLHSTIPCAPPPRRHRRPRRQRQRPTRHGRWADHPQHYSDRKGPKPEGRPSSSQPYHAGAWACPAPLRATLHTRGMRVLRSSTSTLPPERTREMPRSLSENSKARLPVPTPPLILVVVAQVGSPPAPWLVRTLPPTARPLAHQHRPVAGLSAALLRVPPGANAPRVRPTGLVLLVFVHDLPHLPQRGDTRHHPRPQLRDSQAIRSRDANGAGVEMAAAMSVGVGVVHLPAAAAARHAGWRRGGGGLGGWRPSRRAITGATRRDACPTGTGRRARSGRRRGGGGGVIVAWRWRRRRRRQRRRLVRARNSDRGGNGSIGKGQGAGPPTRWPPAGHCPRP